jgi:hypothetical protein
MTDVIQWLYVISLFAAGILVGGLFHAWKLIVGALRELPQVTQVRVHQGMLFLTPDRFMQPCGLIAGLGALAILLCQFLGSLQDGSVPMIVSAVCLVVGLLGIVGVVITSRYFGTRINAIIGTWSLDAIPPEYPAMRRKWDKTHLIRTSCGAVAFLGFLLSYVAFRLSMGTDAVNILVTILIFVNAVVMAILAGSRAMTILNIIPEKDKMPMTMAMQTHQSMFDLKKDSYMKPTGIFCGLSVIALLILLGVTHQLTVPLGVVYGIALAGVLVVVVTANRFLVPFHTKVLTWSCESPPAEYAEGMRTFGKVMWWQLVASLVGWMCVLIGGIVLLKAHVPS